MPTSAGQLFLTLELDRSAFDREMKRVERDLTLLQGTSRKIHITATVDHKPINSLSAQLEKIRLNAKEINQTIERVLQKQLSSMSRLMGGYNPKKGDPLKQFLGDVNQGFNPS